MKIDFSQKLCNLDGQPLKDGDKDVTLSLVASTALLQADPDDKSSGPEKARCFDVAQRVYKGGVCEVSAEEITLIKDKIGRAYSPIVVGPAYRFLEQKA